MPSTSIHIAATLLEELDQLASEQGMSRDQLITEACRKALLERRSWPADFFDNARFSKSDLEELRASGQAFEESLAVARRNRGSSPA